MKFAPLDTFSRLRRAEGDLDRSCLLTGGAERRFGIGLEL